MMKTVVIGGHTRNIGKTSVISALIRELAPFGWTAVKITQYGHSVCSHDGKPCDCAPKEHPFVLTEEADSSGRADTCRYLAAGARRSLWLRARQGQLGAALPLLSRKLRGEEWVIIESNSILEFVRPALYLVVVNGSQRDFKPSARRALAQADAFVLTGAAPALDGSGSAMPDVSLNAALGAVARDDADGAVSSHLIQSRPAFPVSAPAFWSPALSDFIRRKLEAAGGASSEFTWVPASGRLRSAQEETWRC